MRNDLSPKELASVIGISESSLKRWVDEGRLTASRTAGGHRRIPLYEAIRFIRDTNATIADPELLGFTDLSHDQVRAVLEGHADVALKEALEAGRANEARGLILACHLKMRSVAHLCDGPIAFAMHRLGELWLHSERGVMVEHRAVEIVIEAIHHIRSSMQPTQPEAPIAIGGGAEGDPYVLPSLLAATTLREVGFRDVPLGPNTPMRSLADAAREHNPRLIWVSMSTDEGRDRSMEGLRELSVVAENLNAVLAVGGRAVFAKLLPEDVKAVQISTMAELASLGRGVLSRSRVGKPDRPRGGKHEQTRWSGHKLARDRQMS
ncbi:MAG: excisionase family DNA-binding protein [Phycisphaeraceae bacterium]|nr:excisionase family DNA-binding protein [Phycisphaeraceae bacterium]